MTSRRLRPHPQRGFTQVVGVGGIGTGTIFALQGNHTLGRNESRMGAIVNARDYCKLHIVEHYVAALLSLAPHNDSCEVIAVGNVGSDPEGATLIREMKDIGIDTRHVRVEPGCRTMSSVVFLYPDNSGGNITASNSASAKLNSDQLMGCRDLLKKAGGHGIALCLPEVPLDKRAEFLCIATECGSYRVASFASGEMQSARKSNLLAKVDLLALNREEAIEFAGGALHGADGDRVRAVCAEMSTALNSSMKLVVSAGAEGAQVFEDGQWTKHEAIPMEAISTAGAGDALLGGTIAGLVAGLPLSGNKYPVAGGKQRIHSAIDLGLMLAAFSVTSPHTIHPSLTFDSLLSFAEARGFLLSQDIANSVTTDGARVAAH